MGQTAIYNLRWPERTGEAADGPDGYKDLASDIDDQMIRFRSGSHVDGLLNPAITVPTDTTVSLTNQLVTPIVHGWVVVEYQVNIMADAAGNYAGFVHAHIGRASDATQPIVRSHRFHNEASGVLWYVSGRMAFSTLDLEPVRFQIEIYNDKPSSGPLRVSYLPYGVQQYGGKPV